MAADARAAGPGRIELRQGDITEERVDAIVNAANDRLAGGGGVDGAIHRRGGPSILEACLRLGGCPTGDARATPAGGLPARHVIHAVGPVWRGGNAGEPALLVSAYARSLEVAEGLGARSVAFPSLSTGAYGYPVGKAAPLAIGAVRAYLERGASGVELVRFVLFDDVTYGAYRAALASS